MALVDNFDSYNDGDLNGQGSWSGSGNFDIQGSVVQSGTKAVLNTTSGTTSIGKSVTFAADGTQSFYMRKSNTNLAMITRFHQSGSLVSYVILNDDGKAEIITTGGTEVPFADWSTNTWHKYDFSWRSSDGKIRARQDSGTWSDWYAPHGAIVGGIDEVVLRNANTSDDCYWDNFTDGSTPEVTGGGMTTNAGYWGV